MELLHWEPIRMWKELSSISQDITKSTASRACPSFALSTSKTSDLLLSLSRFTFLAHNSLQLKWKAAGFLEKHQIVIKLIYRYNVGSGPVLIVDRRTIKLFGFTFDADKAPDGYFFVGRGPNIAHDAGVKVPIRGRDHPESLEIVLEMT